MLFIFESIGTSELIMIGIIALIFLGPRKLPQMAKKIGKLMTEFRGTANEFKETWQREVSFDEEVKTFDLNALESEAEAKPTARTEGATPASLEAPSIREVDPGEFASLTEESTAEKEPADLQVDVNAKETWL